VVAAAAPRGRGAVGGDGRAQKRVARRLEVPDREHPAEAGLAPARLDHEGTPLGGGGQGRQ
jgi:hypothetical protein